jgi:hypothetical protein
MNGGARSMMLGGGLMLAGSAAALTAMAVSGSLAGSGAGSGLGFMALMGLGMLTVGAMRVPAWARRRKAQITEVIARLTAQTTRPGT